jgi:hypothetical protein
MGRGVALAHVARDLPAIASRGKPWRPLQRDVPREPATPVLSKLVSEHPTTFVPPRRADGDISKLALDFLKAGVEALETGAVGPSQRATNRPDVAISSPASRREAPGHRGWNTDIVLVVSIEVPCFRLWSGR